MLESKILLDMQHRFAQLGLDHDRPGRDPRLAAVPILAPFLIRRILAYILDPSSSGSRATGAAPSSCCAAARVAVA